MNQLHRNRAARVVWVGTVLWLGCGGLWAQATKPASFSDGQSIEVREGDTWSAATLVKKEGRRYQIRYEDGTEEWVTADRLRQPGSDEVVGAGPANQPGTTQPAARPAAPKGASYAVGQKAEVKWGGTWYEAVVLRKQGEWTLVQYDFDKTKEWVEPWRFRKVGSTEDEIGFARPRFSVRDNNEPAPKEPPGAAPEPRGVVRRRPVGAVPGRPAQPGAAQKADEELTKDSSYKAADVSAAEKIDLVGETNWKLEADPCAEAAKQLTRPIPLKSLKGEAHDAVDSVLVPRGAGGIALVAVTYGGIGASHKFGIEKLDVVTGKSLGLWQLGTNMKLMDARADAKVALVRIGDGFGGSRSRLEMWSLEEATPKRMMFFFPHQSLDTQNDEVEGARFVDDEHALTWNSAGLLVMWDLAAAKARYTCRMNRDTTPGLSGGGKYLALAKGRTAYILETSSGKVLAEMPVSVEWGSAFGFSPSGKQLVAWSVSTVMAWDLASGALVRDFSVSVANHRGFGVIGDNYLLASTSMPTEKILIDLERRIPLWRYEQGTRSTGMVAANGRYYYAGFDEQRGAPMLRVVELPNKAARDLAQTLKPEDLLLLKPGSKVSIVLNLNISEQERREITESIRKRLEENKLAVEDNQPIRLVANTEPGRSEQRAYRRFGAGPWDEPTKVTVQEQLSKLKLEVNGKVAWERQGSSMAGFMLNMKEGQSIEQAVAEASKPSLDFFKMVTLPTYLAKPREPAWYGSSKIDAP